MKVVGKFLTVAVTAAGFLGAGVSGAFALNSDYAMKNQSGKHQFYVYCSGGDISKDYTTTADGANATEAQMKAYEAAKAKAGNTSCWPVWQGLVQ